MAFGLLMGATHMATLPPTSALVASRYGTASLSMLFGVVLMVHQAGSFLGIWLGGILVAATGADSAFWALDMALAITAAILVLPAWKRAREPRWLARPEGRPTMHPPMLRAQTGKFGGAGSCTRREPATLLLTQTSTSRKQPRRSHARYKAGARLLAQCHRGARE